MSKPSANSESRFAAALVSDVVRRVAEQVRVRSYETSLDEALFMIASDLESEALNLDPEPLLYVRDDRGVRAGERAAYAMRQYLDPELVSFDPREGFNRNEFRYVEWVNHRERNL